MLAESGTTRPPCDTTPARSVTSPAPPIDEIAVERAINGDPAHLTRAERGEAIRILHQRGLTAAQIAQRLRVTERTVQRWRSRLGLAATPTAAGADQRRATVAALLERGLTQGQIARATGLSQAAVWTWVHVITDGRPRRRRAATQKQAC